MNKMLYLVFASLSIILSFYVSNSFSLTEGNFNVTIILPKGNSTIYKNYTPFVVTTNISAVCQYGQCMCSLINNEYIVCGCHGPIQMNITGGKRHFDLVENLTEKTGNNWHRMELTCIDNFDNRVFKIVDFYVDLPDNTI